MGRWIWVLALTGCLSEPALDGQSLLCSESDPNACSEFEGDWRCIEGGCVENEAPSILGFSATPDGEPILGIPISIGVGDTQTVYGFARDTDGDPVTLEWTQLEKPGSGVDEPVTGSTVTINNAEQGTYRYTVRPSDGRTEGLTATIDVIASASEITHVSLLGEDTVDCGAILDPCESIAHALSIAPTSEIRLAAAAEPYRHCIGGAPTESTVRAERITGCFSAETWEALEGRPDLCRVECAPFVSIGVGETESAAIGHRVTGGTRLVGITTTLDMANAEFAPDVSAVDFSSTVTALGDVEAILLDSDVVGAACGLECLSVAFAAFGGRASLENVNITAASDGFETVLGFFGVLAEQSSLTLIGNTNPFGSPPERPRGEISLNAAATALAVGVRATESTLMLDGIAIRGGFGAVLSGIEAIGSNTTVEDSLVDILGFGTRDVRGVDARDCIIPCGDGVTEDCDPEASCSASAVSTLTVTRAAILLAGTTTAGLAPCVGLGVQMDSASRAFTVTDSVVRSGPEFTLAAGILYSSPEGSVPPTPDVMTVQGNQVEIDGATADDLCLFLNAQTQLAPGGFVGVRAERAKPGNIDGNAIRVGRIPSVPEDVLINSDLTGFGMILRGEQGGDDEVLAQRNEIVVGTGVGLSSGVFLDASEIVLENNLIYGGDNAESIGVNILAEDSDVPSASTNSLPYPELRFNTVVGGGYAGRTPASRALRIRTSGATRLSDVGSFAGNLLDAGLGTGRRAIIENGDQVAEINTNATPADNQGQLTLGASTGFREVFLAGGDSLIYRVVSETGEITSFAGDEEAARLEAVSNDPVGFETADENTAVDSDGRVVAAGASGISVFEPTNTSGLGASELSPYGSVTQNQQVVVRDVEVRTTFVDKREGREVLLLLDLSPNVAASGLYRMQELVDGQFGPLEPIRDTAGVLRNPDRLVILDALNGSDELYVLSQEGNSWFMDRLFTDEDEGLQDALPRFGGRLSFLEAGESLEALEIVRRNVQGRPVPRYFITATFRLNDGLHSYIWAVSELDGVGNPCVGDTTMNCVGFAVEDPCGADELPGAVLAYQEFVYACGNGRILFQDINGETPSTLQILSDAEGEPVVDIELAFAESGLVGLALIPSLDRVVSFTIDTSGVSPQLINGQILTVDTNFAILDDSGPLDDFSTIDGFNSPVARCGFVVDGAESLEQRDLRLGAPCPSAITGSTVPAIDIDGEARSDSSPDYGADEVSP
ncbi:MAG: hypothetical protein AAFX94_00020 [Myxococcota bacterium]